MLHNFLNALEFWCGSSLPVTSGIKTQVPLVLISMMNIAEFFGQENALVPTKLCVDMSCVTGLNKTEFT